MEEAGIEEPFAEELATEAPRGEGTGAEGAGAEGPRTEEPGTEEPITEEMACGYGVRNSDRTSGASACAVSFVIPVPGLISIPGAHAPLERAMRATPFLSVSGARLFSSGEDCAAIPPATTRTDSVSASSGCGLIISSRKNTSFVTGA